MRCLIVEDDFMAQQLLVALLADNAECSVASDGKAGIEYFVMALNQGAPYDLVLLDIMMPQQDGHETLQQIRQIESERGITGSEGVKVIVTTALNDSKNISSAFNEGCGAYLIKPIGRVTLLGEMEKLGLLVTS